MLCRSGTKFSLSFKVFRNVKSFSDEISEIVSNNQSSSKDRPRANQAINTPSISELNNEKKKEIGGPLGPEPTRYGDWERKGRVSDF